MSVWFGLMCRCSGSMFVYCVGVWCLCVDVCVIVVIDSMMLCVLVFRYRYVVVSVVMSCGIVDVKRFLVIVLRCVFLVVVVRCVLCRLGLLLCLGKCVGLVSVIVCGWFVKCLS